MSTRALAAGAAALALLATVPAAAQSTLTVDLALNSAFVWRGVTSTNRPVIDPTLLLTVPAKGTSLTFGGWANAEPGHYDGEHDISALAGNRGPLVTASQLWVEAARGVKAATVTLGATRYLYPDVGTVSTTYATNEVYGIAAFSGALAPSLAVYYDVQKVRGAYLELGLKRDVALPVPHISALSFGASVGYSAGQGTHQGVEQTAYFSHDGVTHVDLSVKTSYVVGRFAVNPTAHLVAGRDEWTRVTAPGESHGMKGWLGASVSWAGALSHARAASAPVAAPANDEAKSSESGTSGTSR
jgi:hypothetical protein